MSPPPLVPSPIALDKMQKPGREGQQGGLGTDPPTERPGRNILPPGGAARVTATTHRTWDWCVRVRIRTTQAHRSHARGRGFRTPYQSQSLEPIAEPLEMGAGSAPRCAGAGASRGRPRISRSGAVGRGKVPGARGGRVHDAARCGCVIRAQLLARSETTLLQRRRPRWLARRAHRPVRDVRR
jgi:hypothetical protein